MKRLILTLLMMATTACWVLQLHQAVEGLLLLILAVAALW